MGLRTFRCRATGEVAIRREEVFDLGDFSGLHQRTANPFLRDTTGTSISTTFPTGFSSSSSGRRRWGMPKGGVFLYGYEEHNGNGSQLERMRKKDRNGLFLNSLRYH